MDPIYAALLSWAVGLSGLAMPGAGPTVLRAEKKIIEAEWGRASVAGYRVGHGEIVVACEPSADLECRGWVVHELVHFLQDVHGTVDVKDCESRRAAELQAYAVQAEYLRKHGHGWSPVLRGMVCAL